MSDNKVNELLETDPVLREAMDEILRIQPRFDPDPAFSKTGIGVLRSEGVDALNKLKKQEHSDPS